LSPISNLRNGRTRAAELPHRRRLEAIAQRLAPNLLIFAARHQVKRQFLHAAEQSPNQPRRFGDSFSRQTVAGIGTREQGLNEAVGEIAARGKGHGIQNPRSYILLQTGVI
jgi:hypothetical protein